MSIAISRIAAFCLSVLCFTLTASSLVNAQSCPNEPQGGGEGITGSVSVDGSGTELIGSGFVTACTRVRLVSFAYAGGQCVGKAWFGPQGSNCVCQETGYVYQRTINHTIVDVDITSCGG